MLDFYKNDPDLSPLPYAEEVFARLKENGLFVALNTGFTKTITDTILKRLSWNKNENIHCVISSDEVPKGRPFPFMIHSIMQTLKINDAHQVVKIGDTEVDVREGRNAACGMVISVTTGAYTRDQLAEFHPDHIIDSLSELPYLLHLN
jgi:phosphonatase-like hydrolase